MPAGDKFKLDDDLLDSAAISDSEKRRFLAEHPHLLDEILRQEVTPDDLVAIAYRKAQLSIFERLLSDAEFFAAEKSRRDKRRDEDVWQDFFERNTWILGHGLDYVFRSELPKKKLEQITSGAQWNKSGKRVDALLRTRGILSMLCFVEFKRHDTPLIGRNPRTECWAISDDLADAVAQVQKTVFKACQDIQEQTDLTDFDGAPTGERVFLYQPKSYVIAGSLSEFQTEHGVNREQLSSFELFRRNCMSPEVVTFDELIERARHIVEHYDSPDANGDAGDEARIPSQSEDSFFEPPPAQNWEVPF